MCYTNKVFRRKRLVEIIGNMPEHIALILGVMKAIQRHNEDITNKKILNDVEKKLKESEYEIYE